MVEKIPKNTKNTAKPYKKDIFDMYVAWRSIPASMRHNDAGAMTAIKQLYISYALSDKIKLTMGKWATHVGFELLDAYANRNYSMSYGFSYGPFFHTGLKADISLGGKSAFMIGVANPTDFTTTTSGNKVAIAQFSTGTKNDKLKAFLNYQGGSIG